MKHAPAPAKVNLALVVGPVRPDGKHEVATVLQRVELADHVSVAPARTLRVEGFAEDTLVRDALVSLAEAAGVPPAWVASIDKRVPVAAGLGGGSSDAATALRLANESLARPLPAAELEALAAQLGADVPFFLRRGPQLGTGDGSLLEPVELPQGFAVLLLLPSGTVKESTAAVYRRFDERGGEAGFAERRAALAAALARVRRPGDLAALPRNDLAASPHAEALERLGALRADVSGAGPTVYGLFAERRRAEAAAAALGSVGRTWVTAPCW